MQVDGPAFLGIDMIRQIIVCPHIERCRAESGKIVDRLPTADYIGPRYRQGGLVILGANPGIASNPNQVANDNRMFLLQEAVANGDEGAFNDLMQHLPISMLGWMQMVNQKARDYLQYDIEEIAHVNLVKCGTRPGCSDVHSLFSGTARNIPQRCWETHTQHILKSLKPNYIVSLWLPIRDSLIRLGYSFDGIRQFGAHNGNRKLNFQSRMKDVKIVFDAYKASQVSSS